MWYYYGLPSNPRLEGRSDAEETSWDSRIDPHWGPDRKQLTAVGFNPLLYEKFFPQCRDAVIKILYSYNLDWNSIDWVRIGYAEDAHVRKAPIILWVGVEPGTTPPGTGFEAAYACREELRKHGINDVEVEIRATKLNLSASTTASQQLLTREAATAGLETHLSLTEEIGQSVALESNPTREATFSSYLRLLREDGKWVTAGLISRHLVEKDDSTPIRHQAGDSQKFVVMPGTSTFDDILRNVKKVRDVWANLVANADMMSVKEEEHNKAQNLLNHLESIKELKDRRVGCVVYAPARLALTRMLGNTRVEWLPDYATVELDSSRFGTPLDQLANKVFLGDHGAADLGRINKEFLLDQFSIPPDGYLHLSGVLPEAEIRNPKEMNNMEDMPQLRVGKVGRGSGLT